MTLRKCNVCNNFKIYINNIAPSVQAQKCLLYGAHLVKMYVHSIASAADASEENIETFREICISKTMVLQRKLLTGSATTSMMNVFFR